MSNQIISILVLIRSVDIIIYIVPIPSQQFLVLTVFVVLRFRKNKNMNTMKNKIIYLQIDGVLSAHLRGPLDRVGTADVEEGRGLID